MSSWQTHNLYIIIHILFMEVIFITYSHGLWTRRINLSITSSHWLCYCSFQVYIVVIIVDFLSGMYLLFCIVWSLCEAGREYFKQCLILSHFCACPKLGQYDFFQSLLFVLRLIMRWIEIFNNHLFFSVWFYDCNTS